MRTIMLRRHAYEVTAGLTQTSKMPCKSYSLPTVACRTGAKLAAQHPDSVCAHCYANKGFYSMYANSVQPAQHARLVSLEDPLLAEAMATLIGTDPYFRWHDSGDLQSLGHLELIVLVCERTPDTLHWLPTREYATVHAFIAKHGALPANLTVRLSAMFPDQPVKIPASLRDVPGILTSNVHTVEPIGLECEANKRGGKCGDCRTCWSRDVETVSYRMH
jgi:hypothetical protein